MKLSKIAILSTFLLASSVAMAAPSNKSISLSWQGTVPTAPLTSGDWQFVDISTSLPYVPTAGLLTITTNPVVVGEKKLSAAATSFGIKATSGTLKPSSDVSAYLSVAPTFVGLVATDASAESATMDITMNDKKLVVGSAGAVKVATLGVTPDAVVGINVSGSGVLPVGSYTEGNVVTVTAVVMMTAELI